MRRRDFVSSSLKVAASSCLVGCANYPMVRSTADICLLDLKVARNTQPLQIDVHCHVFNSSDLQVEGFINKVLTHEGSLSPELARYLAAMLQSVSDGFAPAAASEARLIAKFLEDNKSWFSAPEIDRMKLFEVPLRDGDRATDQEILRVLNSNPSVRQPLLDVLRHDLLRMRAAPSVALREEGAFIDQRLIPLLESPLKLESLQELQRSPSFANAQEFLKPMLRLRYSNCYALMKAFSCSPGEVDLYVASLVDFNHWIGPAETRASPLRAQLDAMEQIMRLMGGKVHCFAPFNPWAHIADASLFPALKNAVENRGFIGFKIYPPMGFSPWGNQALPEKDRPPSWRNQSPRFAAMIDEAMMSLFDWCSANAVPIMAHGNPSNGLDTQSEVMGSPQRWQFAYAEMEKRSIKPPRISFGHFGGDDPSSSRDQWSTGFLELFSKQPDAYGDLSYWEHILEPVGSPDRTKVVAALRTMISGTAEAKNRLMYGTDWNMLAMEARWQEYFNEFGQVVNDAGAASSYENLIGNNAAHFLGLRPDNNPNTRSRLLKFYSKWNMPMPTWAIKTERLV